MTDPRNPLITGVTNDPSYRGDDKLPTSYALNQLFSGEALPANKNVNDVVTCGNYRFIATCTNLPQHMLGTTGILTVMHDRYASPSNGNFGQSQTVAYLANVVHQVAWPDGPIDVTPYTRTFKNGSWGEWQTMGGGLRRVKLTANVADNAVQTNVMYYSFGNFSLALPDPNTAGYSYGTKVGLEQYSGNGSISSPNPSNASDPFTIVTTPTYQMGANGSSTSTIIGPTMYIFEVIEGSNGTKQWMLDMDNDEAARLNGLEAAIGNEAIVRKNADDALDVRINNEASTRASADTDLNNKLGTGALSTGATYSSTNTVDKSMQTEQSARSAADSALDARLGAGVTSAYSATKQFANKAKKSKVYQLNGWTITTGTFVDGNNEAKTIAQLLSYIDPTITVTANCSAWLPPANSYLEGTRVTIEITGAFTVTVYISSSTTDNTDADSEAFTNSTGNTLVLPFEVTYGADGLQWSLLVAG